MRRFLALLRMGVYTLTIGKGVMIPVKWFVHTHLKEITKKHKAYVQRGEWRDDPSDVIREVVQEKYGPEFDISPVGHDAFESRHGFASMGILNGSEQQEALAVLKGLTEECKELNLPTELEEYTHLDCGSIMFIGFHEDIASARGGEFEYYLKTPELLYGLVALIPSIIRLYQVMSTKDTSELAALGKPVIWTFATDCCCCG